MSAGDLPPTETRDPATSGLDVLSTDALVDLLVAQQRSAGDAAAAQSEAIASAVDAIVERLRAGGRLHYVGAGTSGRLAVLDAAEIPPTFGTAPELVQAHIAGGIDALVRAVEGAEDDGNAGEAVVRASVGERDAVVGISASGGARFVVGAVEAARALGALTIALTAVADSALAGAAERCIAIATGPEPLAGSTRLRAGAAQKIALATLSTAVMVRLGKVHDNLMVDVVATNRKLQARAVRLVCHLLGIDASEATVLLDRAGGRVKCAVVMARRGVDAAQAQRLLADAHGSLRPFV